MSIDQMERKDADVAALENEVREWIAQNWKGENSLDWRKTVVAAGWAAPTWPKDFFGRGLTPAQGQVVLDVFNELGVPGGAREIPGPNTDLYIPLAGNTIQAFGNEEFKREFLPKLLTGEAGRGCLFYSEPGAGSDLAGLQTRAERDGDEFIVNGQKIWTSGAQEADFGLLMARTDWDVPKHAGLSFFIMPVKQPGIEVRPIKQMTGGKEFNEVFFTDARVPAKNLVGQINDGWRVLQVALMAERASMGGAYGDPEADEDARPSIFTASEDLIEAARKAGLDKDSATRQELAKIHSWRLLNGLNGRRAAAELSGGSSSSLASLGKLAKSRVLHQGWAFRYRMQGQSGLEYDYDADRPMFKANDIDEPDFHILWSFINSIGGGSDQIQRNIISERVLGLPKGIEPDKGVPFRDVKKGVAPKPLS